jgi:uncharacterized membrane protein YphA (DoxX/SURF4 family)
MIHHEGSHSWREKGTGIARIAFGAVWAVDAYLKWQPGFQNNFLGFLTGALDGQPAAVQAWINLWIRVVQADPKLFAVIVACTETAIAAGLLLGAFSNLTAAAGTLLSLVIWTTAEGFGGPYVSGSTDVGAAIVYVILFAALFFARAGSSFGLDRRLTPALGRWGFLASP